MTAPTNDRGLPGPGPSGPVDATAAPARPAVVPLALVTAGGGIALGAAWVELGRLLARWTGPLEDAAAHDVAYALLAVLAGVITAGVLIVRPGRRPGLQAGLVLGAVTLAALLGWGVGLLLGAPPLHAVAMVVVWPFVTAVLTTVRSLISVLLGPS